MQPSSAVLKAQLAMEEGKLAIEANACPSPSSTAATDALLNAIAGKEEQVSHCVPARSFRMLWIFPVIRGYVHVPIIHMTLSLCRSAYSRSALMQRTRQCRLQVRLRQQAQRRACKQRCLRQPCRSTRPISASCRRPWPPQAWLLRSCAVSMCLVASMSLVHRPSKLVPGAGWSEQAASGTLLREIKCQEERLTEATATSEAAQRSACELQDSLTAALGDLARYIDIHLKHLCPNRPC